MTLPNGANDRVRNEGNLLDRMDRLERLVASMGRRDVDIAMVSDLTDNLGDVRAGRFLALSTGGEPDDEVACGVGMDAAGQEFAGGTFNIYGVQNGALMFGLSAERGEAVFLGGAGTIGAQGIQLNGETYAIQQTASGAATRAGRLEMTTPGGGTVPAWAMSYTEYPAGTSLMTNGGFESGDFTAWTKTTETNGVWAAGTITTALHEGTVYARFTPTATNFTGVLTSARATVTAGSDYQLDFAYCNAGKSVSGTVKAELKWYNDPAAGTLLRTDTAMNPTAAITNWKAQSYVAEAPAGAVSAAVVYTYTGGIITGLYLSIDDVSLAAVTVSKQLLFTDSGMSYSDGMWPEDASWWFYEVTSSPTLTEYLNTSYVFGVVWGTAAADANDGDSYPLPGKLLKAGTYQMQLKGGRNTDRAKVDIIADGLAVATVDLYGASDVNFTWTSAAFDLPYSGLHRFEIKVNGKHVSSSDYRVILNKIRVYKV